MKRHSRRQVIKGIGAAGILGTAGVSTAAAQGRGAAGSDLIAPLTHGESENPDLERTGASGFAKFSFDGDKLDYTITARNIEDLTQAHIHGRAPRGERAGVVAFLIRFADSVTGPSDQAESSSPGDPIVVEGTVDNTDLVTAIKNSPEQYYVNVHTVGNPAGEIRGQLRES
jgi:hypothetical protein